MAGRARALWSAMLSDGYNSFPFSGETYGYSGSSSYSRGRNLPSNMPNSLEHTGRGNSDNARSFDHNSPSTGNFDDRHAVAYGAANPTQDSLDATIDEGGYYRPSPTVSSGFHPPSNEKRSRLDQGIDPSFDPERAGDTDEVHALLSFSNSDQNEEVQQSATKRFKARPIHELPLQTETFPDHHMLHDPNYGQGHFQHPLFAEMIRPPHPRFELDPRYVQDGVIHPPFPGEFPPSVARMPSHLERGNERSDHDIKMSKRNFGRRPVTRRGLPRRQDVDIYHDDSKPSAEAGFSTAAGSHQSSRGKLAAGEDSTGDPAAYDPPAYESQGAYEAPAGEPPAGEPPAYEPPAYEPPADEAPAGEPSAGEPPEGELPAGAPPADGDRAANEPAQNESDEDDGRTTPRTEPTEEELEECATPRSKDALYVWYTRFGELNEFRQQNGHCNVRQKYEDNPQLGIWVNKQRCTKESLSDQKRDALDSIGFDWGKKKGDYAWNQKFEELVAYKNKYGNCLVPTKFNENPSLGRWISTQRSQYKLYQDHSRSTMTDEKVQKLEALGFVWSMVD